MRTNLTDKVIRQFALGTRDRLRNRKTGPRWLRSDSADLSYLLLSVLERLETRSGEEPRRRSEAMEKLEVDS